MKVIKMVVERKKCVIIWFATIVLGLTSISYEAPGVEYKSFSDVLKAKARWDIIRGLESWQRELSKDDVRIVSALKSEIVKEEHRNHLEQELLAILKQDSGDEMIDYVANVIATQKSSFDQEYIISFLARSELSNKVKMRLYSHYEQFMDYGRHAVIRGLSKIDNEATFDQLIQI